MIELIIFVTIIIIWSILILIATFRDIYRKKKNLNNNNTNDTKDESVGQNVWNCMSQPYVYKQAIRMRPKFKPNGEPNIPDDKSCIFDAFRAEAHLSSLIYHFGGNMSAYRKDNVNYVFRTVTHHLWFPGYYGFKYYMDLSLFSSGVASIKWFIRAMNKTGGTRLATVTARYYFDRILRIVPLYYLSFYFYLIYVRYWVSERYYDKGVEKLCYTNYMYNLLFVANIFDKQNGLCMPWTWTFNVIVQYVLVTPIFAILLYKKPKLGIIALILGNVWSICSVFYIIYSNGITTEGVREVLIYNNNPVNPVYNPTGSMYFLHITAFRYGTAYFTGIIFGYLMEMGHLPKIYASSLPPKIMWILSTYLLSSIIIGELRDSSLFGGLPVFTAIEHALSGIVPLLITCYLKIICTMYGTSKLWKMSYKFYSSRYWRPLRVCQQTSYLHHLVLGIEFLNLIPEVKIAHETTNEIYAWAIPMQLAYTLVYLVLDYAIMIPLTAWFELPFLGLQNIASKAIFDKTLDVKDKHRTETLEMDKDLDTNNGLISDVDTIKNVV